MSKRNVVLTGLLGATLFCGTLMAQKPVRNVSPRRHPNIAAAQSLTQHAFERIIAAQKANEWDLDGHAQKAKELLDQANQELKRAAQTSNREHR